MNLNTETLKAFLVLQEHGSFTRAAQVLGLTQSALSQKISKLEEALEATLLIRKPEGLELTAAGKKLLPFARQQLTAETEFLDQFHSSATELKGVFRIAAYSSVMRSMIIPALVPLMKKHPRLQIEFSTYEVDELEQVLKGGKAEMVIVDRKLNIPHCEEQKIGDEEYVVIQSAKLKTVPEIYFDHAPEDTITEIFFKYQGHHQSWNRGFMGDVYGILDAVALGLGKAVMSRHLVETDPRFKLSPAKKKFLQPVMLYFFRQGYYTRVHQEVLSAIENQKTL